MTPDERIPSENVLGKEFSVSRMTVNKAINNLVNEGFLYRIKGSGTYVRNPFATKQPVYFLLPCPEYFVYDCTYPLRLLLGGMLQEASNSGLEVKGIPVSKVNNPEKIDWGALEELNSDSIVVVSGFWFKEVIPFLRKRGCRVIFCDLSTDGKPKYPEYFSEWLKLVVNTRKAMSQAVQFMYKKGFRKIGYVYRNYPQDDSLNAGYREGLAETGLDFDEQINFYTGNTDSFYDRLLDRNTDFDALIIAHPDLLRQTQMLLKASGRQVPEDTALIVFDDRDKFCTQTPAISAVALPVWAIGQRIIKEINSPVWNPETIEFETSIFERESISKKAGININTGSLPVQTEGSGFSF
jgi:GntR family transcriptional regulator of arabinose operon